MIDRYDIYIFDIKRGRGMKKEIKRKRVREKLYIKKRYII